MRKTIADIVSEASSVACWMYVQKYVKQKTLDEMLQELPGASQFSPVMTFKLWEKFSDSCLEVSENMEVNGKKTFGYDEPIIYKRV